MLKFAQKLAKKYNFFKIFVCFVENLANFLYNILYDKNCNRPRQRRAKVPFKQKQNNLVSYKHPFAFMRGFGFYIAQLHNPHFVFNYGCGVNYDAYKL